MQVSLSMLECKNVRVWSELIVELGLWVSRPRSCWRSGVGVKTVRTVGAGKLLTAECARIIHSEVSSHSGEVAVKYVEIDSRSERKRRGSDSTVATWRHATECDCRERCVRPKSVQLIGSGVWSTDRRVNLRVLSRCSYDLVTAVRKSRAKL